MLTKKEFCMALGEIQKIHDFQNSFIDLLAKYGGGDSLSEPFPVLSAAEDLLVDLLAEIMNDRDNQNFYGSVVAWWIYGTDFGADLTEFEPEETDDPDLARVRTAEDLFDYLTNCSSRKQTE